MRSEDMTIFLDLDYIHNRMTTFIRDFNVHAV